MATALDYQKRASRKLLSQRTSEEPKQSQTILALGEKVYGTAWLAGKHLEHLQEKLIAVAKGKIKRLIIQMPPRHAKTTMVAHLFAPWFFAQFPDKRIIYTTYEASKAAEWGRKARDVIEGYELGITTRSDSRAANRWNIANHRGGMLTAGIGGPLVGSGANVFIIDDPVKNYEEADSPRIKEKHLEWFDSTAKTRLEPDGAIIIIMHRWSREDLVGRILERAEETGEKWEVVSFPAIAGEEDQLGRQPGEVLWPQRFTLTEMQDRKNTTSPRWWFALYQQDPSVDEGAEFPLEWFDDTWVDDFPTADQCIVKVLSLDPSKGKTDKLGDFSAYVCAAFCTDGLIYVGADMDNRRNATQIVDDGLDHIVDFIPDGFAVETNAMQDLFELLFRKRAIERNIKIRFDKTDPGDGPIWIPYEHYRSKVGRIRDWTEFLCPARKMVRFVRKMKGTKILVKQLQIFPTGGNDPGVDDGPDSGQMALQAMQEISHHPSLFRSRK